MNKDMYEDHSAWVMATHKCCACGSFIRDTKSKFINLVQTNYKASWKYPVMGNVITGGYGFACAIICDDCCTNKKMITKVLEYDGERIVYHHADLLRRIEKPG
jgi:hypothetical protein